MTLLVVYFVGLMAVTAFRRFWLKLSFAQKCANQATCRDCGAYGLFDVIVEDQRIPASCRKCGNRWTIG